MNTNKGLFQDLVVVEFASVLAGPSVGQFFAEMGAEVIKIENLKSRGDVTRRWKLSSENPENSVSAYFAAANWGKKSVCLDLAAEPVRELVHGLIQKADIVLTSFKTGDAEKLQMDYQTLSRLNPKLLYGHITGYGSEVARAGYDAVLQAETGFMYLNGEKDGAPQKMPVALIDLLAAHQLKEGLLAGLYRRERTGQGQYIEVSLLKAAISSLANQATNYLVAGETPQRMGSEHPTIVPYGTIFQTSDGKELVLAVGDDRQFQTLCRVLGDAALADEEIFSTNHRRVQNRTELVQKLSKLIVQFTQRELLQVLVEQNVPAGAVHSVPEALAQPLVQPQLLSDEKNRPGGVRQIAFLSPDSVPLPLSTPPELGQHTREVLQSKAGLLAPQIEKLAQNQLVFTAAKKKEN